MTINELLLKYLQNATITIVIFPSGNNHWTCNVLSNSAPTDHIAPIQPHFHRRSGGGGGCKKGCKNWHNFFAKDPEMKGTKFCWMEEPAPHGFIAYFLQIMKDIFWSFIKRIPVILLHTTVSCNASTIVPGYATFLQLVDVKDATSL